jgi:sulfide:quinone oxidoreductase
MRWPSRGRAEPPPRVLVLGAGLAALEAAFLLDTRLLGRVDLQLVSKRGNFLLRPNLVYVPFGAGWRLMAVGMPAMTGVLAQ